VHVGGVQEASISWEKRQAEVRAKLQQDTDAAAWNSWWENLGGKANVMGHAVLLFYGNRLQQRPDGLCMRGSHHHHYHHYTRVSSRLCKSNNFIHVSARTVLDRSSCLKASGA
jgi:hypothetical protein